MAHSDLYTVSVFQKTSDGDNSINQDQNPLNGDTKMLEEHQNMMSARIIGVSKILNYQFLT